MKSQAEFDVDRDLIDELIRNQENREKLFGPKLDKEIQKQYCLKLNKHTDETFKGQVFAHLSRSQVMEVLKDKLQNDPIIALFFQNKTQDDKKFTFQSQFQRMRDQLKKKSHNNLEPITFFNQFNELYEQVKSCFQVRKGFIDENAPERKKYLPFLENMLPCDYRHLGCMDTFKKTAGVKSHIQHCKAKKEHEQNHNNEGREPEHIHLSKLRDKTKQIDKIEKKRKD